jgi:hypothetical protein
MRTKISDVGRHARDRYCQKLFVERKKEGKRVKKRHAVFSIFRTAFDLEKKTEKKKD